MTDPSPVLVSFAPSGRRVAVAPGTTLLAAARAAGLPLAASCGGEGVCGWCRVRPLAGAEHLAPPDEAERARLRARGADPDERLACRAGAYGPVTITTTYW
jgi:ferredoxin